MITEYVTDSGDAVAAIASTPAPKMVWINGSQTFIYTGVDVPMPPQVET